MVEGDRTGPSFKGGNTVKQGSANGKSDGNMEMPRDGKAVMKILESMGVEEYEPRVIHQLLEFLQRYIYDVLTEARVYSEHASKTAVDLDDVRLAVQAKVNFSFTQPPPREVLMDLARVRNSIPLPPLRDTPGISLPPEADTLLQPNYQISLRANAREENGESKSKRAKEGDGS